MRPRETPIDSSNLFSDLPVIDSERLTLRPLVLDDLIDVFEYASDPEVARYVTWEHHRNIDDSKAFLNLVLAKYRAGEVAPWGLVHRRAERLIGTVGFTWWNKANAAAEIGYTMSRQYWNQGLMTEAVRQIIRIGFLSMQLNRIEACHDVDNPASGRVMEKSGMSREGIRREAVFVKGSYRDLCVYSILRWEFESARERVW